MKLFEEFKEYAEMWDDVCTTDKENQLVESPKEFTDSKYKSELATNKVYTLTGNYWFDAEFGGCSIDPTIKEMLLDPTAENEKYIRQRYVQDVEDLKFCNTNNPGDSKALFFPKGLKLKYIKDVDPKNQNTCQMFTDGKVVLLLGYGINKYLQ